MECLPYLFKKRPPQTFLPVQCLGFRVSTAGGWIQSLVGELRFHMPRSTAKGKKKRHPPFILPVKSSWFKEKWRWLGGRWQSKPKIIQRSKFFPFDSQRKSWGWPEHVLLPKTWPISYLGKTKILKNPTEKSIASLNAEKLLAFPPKDKIKFCRVSYY